MFSLTPDHPLSALLNMGGPVMLALVALALVCMAAFIYLMLGGVLYAPRQTRPLRRALADWTHSRGTLDIDALPLAPHRLQRRNPMVSLVRQAMAACQAGIDSATLRETLGSQAEQALKPFEAPLRIIELTAALSPLLGLLGTVLGMMDAFSTMAASTGRADASQLSGGIYTALSTTAAGLVVAIPAAALAAWVDFRLRRLRQTLNDTLITVLSAGAEPMRRAPQPSAAAHETPHTGNPASMAHEDNGARAGRTPSDQRARVAHATG
ncbi:MotA/TolQ/ExbB proton channel family protein [Marinobacter sp. C2H3]|uniref:MotA/TolQ/ExbB proton channel family protein n=1 Tax=Marinobacter sp. C2H3 TaxID=3119003 RepID=UPI00300F2FDF